MNELSIKFEGVAVHPASAETCEQSECRLKTHRAAEWFIHFII